MEGKTDVESSECCKCCLGRGRTQCMSELCLESNKNYKDMLRDCFNINMSCLDPSICAACVSRLIDAYNFRVQVCNAQNYLVNQQNTNASASTEIKVEHADWLHSESWVDHTDDGHFDSLEKNEFSQSNETLDKLIPDSKLNIAKKSLKTEKKTSEGDLTIRRALLVKKMQLLNEIKAMSNSEIVAQSIDVLKITSNNVLNSSTVPKLSKRMDEPTSVTIKKDKTSHVKKTKIKTKEEKPTRIKPTSSLKDRLKNKFTDLKCIRRNCKDFYLFVLSVSKYICPICEESYMDIDAFKMHARKHTTEETERFHQRRKNLPDVERLRVDISTMQCRHCGESATELQAFRDHLTRSHDIKSDDLFRSLMPYDLKTDEVKCFICSRVFMNIVNLNIHMNEHYANFLCPHCGKPFATVLRLKSHIRRLHSTGTFKCIHCDKMFESFAKRDYHVSVTHYKRVNLCPLCPEKLRTHQAKLVHLAEVHNQELKKYKCESCPEKFVTAGFLSAHIRKVHLNERNHVCSYCGDAFFIGIELKHHMVKHTGEKSFQCQVCEKAYSRKKTLQAHMRIHNNDKRHFCQFCGRAFVQKCSLKSHLSHVHKNEIETN